jgi:hypothetical protein
MGNVIIGAGTDHERSVPIPTFRAFRATYAGLVVGSAFDQFQEVLKAVTKLERDEAEANPIRVTREETISRAASARAAVREIDGLLADEDRLRERVERDNREQWAESEDEAARSRLVDEGRRGLEQRRITFEAAAESADRTLADMGEQGYVEYPGQVEDWQIYAAGFTKAMNVMPTELEKLLGLVVISNADLERVYNEGGREALDEKIEQLGRELLMQGELEEVIKLAAAAGEVIYDQLDRARSALGKLRALYARATKREQQPETIEGSATEEPKTSSTDGSQSSSTSSPASTTGAGETSSSGSRQASSTPSTAG